MTIQGEERTVKGAILFALADTVASHSIGGFKVGVGFALRKCRMCLATGDQISTKVYMPFIDIHACLYGYIQCLFLPMQFKAREFTLRTLAAYDYHCGLLDGPLQKEDSVTYGINYASPLNELDNFHVVNQLPQDIMHVLLEGVIPYELSLMIYSFIKEEKYFSLDQLNDRIACFSYSTKEAKDKPSPVRPQVLTSGKATLSQSCELKAAFYACVSGFIVVFSCI